MSSPPRRIVLTLAIAVSLAGCGSAGSGAVAPGPAPAFSGTYAIDESALPAYNRFFRTDIDAGVDACTDFGAHTNGKWLATTALPADQVYWTAFSMLDARSKGVQRQLLEQASRVADPSPVEKILTDLWLTGMDTGTRNAQGISPLAEELAAIDALPDRDAIIQFLHSRAAQGRNVLFELKVSPDLNDPERMIAYATQGGLGLPDPSAYANPDLIQAYTAHASRLFTLSGLDQATAQQMAKQAIGLEQRLAKASTSSAKLSKDYALRYNPVTLAQADTLTPGFNWAAFFDAQGVPAPEMFSLSMPAFHQEASRALSDTSVEAWRAYLRFRTLDSAAPHLGDAFAQQAFDFHGKTLMGAKQMQPHWKRVLQGVNGAAGEALGQLYAHVAFPPEAKARMEVLVHDVSSALRDRLAGAEWLSEATRAQALAKWERFSVNIGHPDTWRDWDGLQTGRDSYLGNLHEAMAFRHRQAMARIGQPVDTQQWALNPQDVNASFNPTLNALTFPAALLQPPFFDVDADDAVNYGAIGAVIGHELLHAYDDQGSRFSATGRLENWWSEQDAQHFKSLGDTLVRQFNEYRIDGQPVNGQMTLGENIADLGGLATAYDALQMASEGRADPMVEGLTRDQRFFYSWTALWRSKEAPEITRMLLAMDPHAPNRFRAIAAPGNLPAFAAAFACTPGAAMVRPDKDRAAIW
ncbi:peptidase [Stenotrophomonas maltophilia]|uniref:Peptidase n=1 Tax=Stenotrophomonas maltophilia TaxID=40324 RepID=A0A1A6Y0L8_STEMA|nr:M13 family metallopeptidase [Stenotrophomonas maltophilia]OBU68366.1 peptidase [Stenotrophomonas maltophilia]